MLNYHKGTGGVQTFFLAFQHCAILPYGSLDRANLANYSSEGGGRVNLIWSEAAVG
jgi:hypothetical protein